MARASVHLHPEGLGPVIESRPVVLHTRRYAAVRKIETGKAWRVAAYHAVEILGIDLDHETYARLAEWPTAELLLIVNGAVAQRWPVRSFDNPDAFRRIDRHGEIVLFGESVTVKGFGGFSFALSVERNADGTIVAPVTVHTAVVEHRPIGV